MIDWNLTYAAIWRQRKEYLRPVRHTDPIQEKRDGTANE